MFLKCSLNGITLLSSLTSIFQLHLVYLDYTENRIHWLEVGVKNKEINEFNQGL